MKAANISNTCKGIGLFIVFLLLLPMPVLSQESPGTEPSETYSREQLAQMLAPIALYPDALLSQVLMASTYPLEVIEADRWVRKNPNLTGDSLDNAIENKDWDPSVKSLTHFPSVLGLMSEKISETTNLGNAFLGQEDEVMDVVQELRARAYEQGNLKSDNKQKVIREKETIIIEPADHRVVYVPYYNSLYVYGPWWYPDYPPFYWGPGPVIVGAHIHFWPAPFVSFALISWSYFDWHHHHIYIDVHRRPRYFRREVHVIKPGHWYHAPRHRRGVAYRDRHTARKYGQHPARYREYRRDVRGFPDRNDRDLQRRDTTWGNRGGIPETPRTVTVPDRDSRRPEWGQSDSRTRERVEQEQRTRERVEQEPRTRERAERDRGTREGVQQERRTRERVQQETRTREKPEPVGDARRERTRERDREQVFGRIGEDGREQQSSRRGRSSRQGGKDLRSWGAFDQGGRKR